MSEQKVDCKYVGGGNFQGKDCANFTKYEKVTASASPIHAEITAENAMGLLGI